MCDLQTLCHPASVDSLSTSAGTEDHVSMGGFAARKCLQVGTDRDTGGGCSRSRSSCQVSSRVQVVRNVEKVIAIELLAACQAIEFLRPLKTTVPLEEAIKVVRSAVAAWDQVSCETIIQINYFSTTKNIFA